MVKERFTNIPCLLISCKYKGSTHNGNSTYNITILTRDIINKEYKVYSGVLKNMLPSTTLKTDGDNGYTPKKVQIDFYITNKNKVVFTELKRI